MPKQKLRALNVPNPLFKAETLFVWNCTSKELGKFLEKKYNVVDFDYEHLAGADGTVLRFDDAPHRLVWCEKIKKNPYWLGVLAHEITHHVLRICNDKGIPVSVEMNADETMAYMVDYYMKSVMENL